jgi:hypothetical protein
MSNTTIRLMAAFLGFLGISANEVLSGTIYSLSGASPTLVAYDATTLLPVGSAAQPFSVAKYDLAFDESGRLFGLGNSSFLEFNPSTLSIIRETPFTGNPIGIAARGGTIYSLSGASPTLVAYDATTLLPVGSAAQPFSVAKYDLAFDESGRLFGLGNSSLLEFDPSTLSIIRETPFTGNPIGIAGQVPEPGSLTLLLMGFAGFAIFLTGKPNKVTGTNSRPASQFESRGLRRHTLVLESRGRYHGGAAVAQFWRWAR